MKKAGCPLKRIILATLFIRDALKEKKIIQAGEVGKWKLYEKYGMPGNESANSLAIYLVGWS
jgi:hypothetical protein